MAISENLKIRFSNVDSINFENLALDFWQKGKAAFDNLPDTPNTPEKNLAKSSSSTIGFSSSFEVKAIWKTTEKISFQAQPRPPTVNVFPEFNFEIAPLLSQISRHIAPRAPPFFV